MPGLELVSETNAAHNSYGFRPALYTADAIQQVCNMYSSRNASKWVLEGDIKGCFEHISHEWLLENIPMDKQILRNWLKTGIIKKGIFSKTLSGTPWEESYLQFWQTWLWMDWKNCCKIALVRNGQKHSGNIRVTLSGMLMMVRAFVAQEMREGPSVPACRRRHQTTHCCCI
ncbi:reverse transcriptase domain-containing protein [Escherichia coli]